MYWLVVIGCMKREKVNLNGSTLLMIWSLFCCSIVVASCFMLWKRSNTTILSLIYRFPSDQRSQRTSGYLSIPIGDEGRKNSVVFQLYFLPLFVLQSTLNHDLTLFLNRRVNVLSFSTTLWLSQCHSTQRHKKSTFQQTFLSFMDVKRLMSIFGFTITI